MIIAVLSGFVFAVLLPLMSRFARKAVPLIFSILPIVLFFFFISNLPLIKNGNTWISYHSWIPSFGIDLSFRLDGLSMLFALMITGIGALVFTYTAYYLKGHPYLDRFYGYLSMFMASMLGVVLSNNLINIFIF